MRWVILFVLAAVPAFAQQKVTPVAPRKPVEVTAPIASIAAASKKIDVSLTATVRKDETDYAVVVRGEHYATMKLRDAKELAAALEKLADGMKDGDRVKVGGFVAAVGKYDNGGKFIVLREDGAIFTGEVFEQDSAGEFAQALLKAEGIAAWLAPRLEAFRARE